MLQGGAMWMRRAVARRGEHGDVENGNVFPLATQQKNDGEVVAAEEGDSRNGSDHDERKVPAGKARMRQLRGVGQSYVRNGSLVHVGAMPSAVRRTVRVARDHDATR